MIILGIDPGIAIMGYGVIESKNGKVRVVDYGAIYTPSKISVTHRLQMIFDCMTELVKKFKPDQVAFEELFFNTNTTTAINVAQARGVAIVVANQHVNDILEFTPLQIKQALTGNGRAEKKQVQYMVQHILGLKEIPKPDDAADALAVALCASQTNTILGKFKM